MSKIFEALQKRPGTSTGPLPPPLSQRVIIDAPSEARLASQEARTGESEGREVTIRAVPVRPPRGIPVFPFGGDRSTVAEQYRMIRTRIAQNVDRQKLILISSPDSGDGKTITTINIAGALALKSDINVLILDADLCRPAVSKSLGIPECPGLSDVLLGTATLQDAIVRLEQFSNLYVLPAGQSVANRTELLDSARWKTLCATIRSRFHFAIVDAPPIDAVADYPLIQEACDYLVVVVRPDHTNRVRCMHALKNAPEGKLIGAVINAAEDWFLVRNNHYHYYGYNAYPYPVPVDAGGIPEK